jgi:hypothetical protein
VSTLGDLARARTDLGATTSSGCTAWSGEWQLVSDLSFADLLLRVRTREGTWLTVAHQRPTTGPTAHPHDVVGWRSTARRPAGSSGRGPAAASCATASAGARRCGWRRCRSAGGDRVVAVVTRETDPAATRSPSHWS